MKNIFNLLKFSWASTDFIEVDIKRITRNILIPASILNIPNSWLMGLRFYWNVEKKIERIDIFFKNKIKIKYEIYNIWKSRTKNRIIRFPFEIVKSELKAENEPNRSIADNSFEPIFYIWILKHITWIEFNTGRFTYYDFIVNESFCIFNDVHQIHFDKLIKVSPHHSK